MNKLFLKTKTAVIKMKRAIEIKVNKADITRVKHEINSSYIAAVV